MNKDYYPQIKSLLQKNQTLSSFDSYYLGFFSCLTPHIVLDDIFGFIKNIIELHRDELLTAEEKLKSFVRMMSRKMDLAALASLVPEDWENPDPKTFLIEFFTKILEIIPKYENITKEQTFFLGYFQAACPTYSASEIFVQIDNVNEALGDNFEDEEAHLDFLLKILDKKIDENRNTKGSLRIPGREGTQSTQANGQSAHHSNGAHSTSVSNNNSQSGARKRRIEFEEQDDDGRKMTKKTEPAENGERRTSFGGRRISLKDLEEDLEEIKDDRDSKPQQNGQRSNLVRRGDSVSSNPFDDLLLEPRGPKKTAPAKKDTTQYDLTELALEEFEGYNAQDFLKPTMKRMGSAEEEALSRAYIEKLQQEEEKEKEKHREKANQQGEANCAICLDDLYSTSFKPLEGCSHVFHEDCMKEYLKSKIDEKGFPIVCPELECKSEITIADVSDFLDQSYAEKFVSFSFKSYLEKNAGEVSCCPTADCAFAFIKEENQVDFKCPVCNKHYCLNCRVEWHKGETCKEYQISHTKDENDVKFEDFVKGQQFKQCPKCGFWVSRTEGCNAMICRCKTQFCYNCGKEGDGHVCPCLTQNRPAGGGLFGALAANPNAGLWGNGGGLFGNVNRNNNLFVNNNLNRPNLFANNLNRPNLFANLGMPQQQNWYNNNPIYTPPNLFANPAPVYNPPNIFNQPAYNPPAYNPPLYRGGGGGGGLFGNLLNPYVNNYDDDDEDDEDYEEGDDLSDPGAATWRPIVEKKKSTRRKKRS